MAVSPYYAEYCRFDTSDKTSGAYLIGADSLVGDEFKIVFETNSAGDTIAKLHNKFNREVGTFDKKTSYRLQVCKADDWELHAVLSAVFLSTDDTGAAHYSGEVAVMCFSRRYSTEFNTFLEGVSSKIAQGTRPVINLKSAALKTVIDSHGEWVPRDHEPKRKLPAGTVVVKDHLKQDEKMVELARKGNPGCMAAGWAFIALLVVGGIWLLNGLFHFLPF